MSRLLQDHRRDLRALLTEGVSEQEKFDGLATEVAQVLDAALDFERPSQKLRYIRKFTQQNDQELQQLSRELSTWISNQSLVQKSTFVARSLLQPYARELADLIPKFQQLAEQENYDPGALEKVLLLFQLKQLIKRK